MCTHDGVGFVGILSSETIGSEKITRISFASSSWRSSPDGPVLTTVSGALCVDANCERRRNDTTTRSTVEKRFGIGSFCAGFSTEQVKLHERAINGAVGVRRALSLLFTRPAASRDQIRR